MVKLTRKQLRKIHEDAVRKQYPLIKQVKEGKLTFCDGCDKIKVEGGWKKASLDEAVKKAIDHSLKLSPGSIVSEIAFTVPEINKKPGIRATEQIYAEVTGHNEELTEDYTEEYEVPISYLVTVCDSCKKKSPTYHQGVLQVRNESELSKIYVKEFIRRLADKGVHLSKKSKAKNGTDYYVSDHRAIGNLARKLHKEFGGELKINAQHFSEDKQAGKILYRTNALVVLPEYSKGCAIEKEGQYYLILGIGNKVKAENLMTGKLESFDYARGETRVLEQVKTQVTNDDPFEVLNPETYQPVQPILSRYAATDFERGEEVLVAVAGKYVILIPVV